MNNNATLGEARRIAHQPIEDRLNGKQGEEAQSVILRLLEEAGLDYTDGLHLLSAFQWHQWNSGWKTGYDSGTRS